MKLTFLVDNKTEDVRTKAEWGLSILVETEGHKYLYDTGGSGMFIENAEVVGANVEDAEAVMISHGHYDHTEGMEDFVKVNKIAPIYIHKNAFHEEWAMEENGELEEENCGLRWTEDFVKSIDDRIVRTEGVTKVSDKLTLIGNIPDMPGYSPTERFFKLVDGNLVKEEMEHEQFLVVEEGEKIHIISGCCHKGAVPTIDYAMKLFPGKEIASFTGGMHTYMLNKEKREMVTAKLKEFGVKKLLPLHCTGMNMIITLKEKLGDDCIIACAGDSVEL